MEKLCEWYRDLHSFAMACALTHYCRTFTRQYLYLEFLTPPLYSSKSSWSAHLEFPGTKMVFFSPGLIASNVQSGHPQTLIGVGGKRIRRSSGIKLTNCKLAMKRKKTYQLYVFDIPFNLCLVVVGPWLPRTSKRSHPHTWLLGHSSSQIAPQVSFTIHAAPNIPGLILIKAVVKVLLLGRGDLNTGAKGLKCSSTTGSSWETNIVMSPCSGDLLW